MQSMTSGLNEVGKMIDKVIKTEKDYEIALDEAESLIRLDPDADSLEGNRLELLTLLIEDYESKNFHFDLPDPIDAIEFRMEQQNLAPRDLIPYIGSRSKVSELLNRKRPLTLSMIRAINYGLGIPAEVLLQNQNLETEVDWHRFPIKEMISRKWIKSDAVEQQDQLVDTLRNFFRGPGDQQLTVPAILLRQSSHIRSARPMNDYALTAWTAYVIKNAYINPPETSYNPRTMNLETMQELAKKSVFDDGPVIAGSFLREKGVSLVIVPHLTGTYLDGAAILFHEQMPIIGLTIRYDRLDNFWFTLMHELAHLALHFDSEFQHFYDDLELDLELEVDTDRYEQDADELAKEALIPQDIWERSPASKVPMAAAAHSLSKQLGIHPAIVAGRIRYELKAYRHLNNLVGNNQVRRLFPKVNWD